MNENCRTATPWKVCELYDYVADFLQTELNAKTLIEGRVGKGYVDRFIWKHI